jgi:hypothetical protein
MQGTNNEAQEAHRRLTNARKAKEVADFLFPGEKWITVSEGIFLSPRRPVGEGSNYDRELRDAQILQSFGSTVYLVPDDSRAPGKKYDAVVDGEIMEFKNPIGNDNSLKSKFLKSREQAPNVFINCEESDLTINDCLSALYGARNNTRYAQKSNFVGGRILLKINGYNELISLDVDSLEFPEH